MADNQPPIIIKKIKKGGDHGHHGGAWKLAYADFVTAMMAFFLLLWLLSATTEVQKEGIADYFAPTFASKSTSGANGVLGGNSISSDNGAQSSGSVVVALTPPSPSASTSDNTSNPPQKPDDNDINKAIAEREEQMFKDAEKELTQAIQNTPNLKEFADNLIIDRTPEGMRIQIVDQDRKSMFESGSAEPLARTKQILQLEPHLDRRPHRFEAFRRPSELFELGALQRPRQRQPPRPPGSRRPRLAHRRSQRHGGHRAAVPRRHDAPLEPANFDNAPTRSAGVATELSIERNRIRHRYSRTWSGHPRLDQGEEARAITRLQPAGPPWQVPEQAPSYPSDLEGAMDRSIGARREVAVRVRTSASSAAVVPAGRHSFDP
jgi:chemotaxis protein MotB